MSYHIIPKDDLVEAWTGWHLPYQGNQTFGTNPTFKAYRYELQAALSCLGQSKTLYASYTFNGRGKHDPDLENVLFYNVNCKFFKANAVESLCFERIDSVVPIPKGLELDFVPLAYIKYEPTGAPRFLFDESAQIASCPPVSCPKRQPNKPPPISRCARLWKIFKPAIVGEERAPLICAPFAVYLQIAAPASVKLNLAHVVKPLFDGFISALHYYEGNALDEVTARLSKERSEPAAVIADLLTRKQGAVLGPKSVLHARAKTLQWSPADDYLAAGKIVRVFSPEEKPLSISGYIAPV